MSNSENFIDEVTDEIRRERMALMLRRYGWIGLVVVAGIVGGAAFNEWQKAQRTARSEAFGGAVLSALGAADPAERRDALASIGATGDAGAMTRLLAAGEALGSTDAQARAAALADLSSVANDAGVALVWQDLARLRLVTAPGGADLSVAERASLIEAMSAPVRPFRTLAIEQRALDRVAAGESAAALADFRALVDDREAPSALRARAGQMIVILGGETLPAQD